MSLRGVVPFRPAQIFQVEVATRAADPVSRPVRSPTSLSAVSAWERPVFFVADVHTLGAVPWNAGRRLLPQALWPRREPRGVVEVVEKSVKPVLLLGRPPRSETPEDGALYPFPVEAFVVDALPPPFA